MRACVCVLITERFVVLQRRRAKRDDAMRLEMIICDNERSDESSFLVSSRAGVEEKSLSLF